MATDPSDELLRDWLEQRMDLGEAGTVEDPDERDLAEATIRAGRCLEQLSARYADGEVPELVVDESSNAPIQLGHFVVVRAIGRGGMATVYEAYDPRIQRNVALKIPHPGLVIDRRARRRFLMEARAAGRLNHPNIVRAYETGEIGSVCYIAYEIIQGPTLSQWLADRDTPLPLHLAVKLTIQIASALQHAHDRGVIHRDLKPSNVLIETPLTSATQSTTQVSDSKDATSSSSEDSEPIARVTDFGLALMVQTKEGLTLEGTRVGTANYMSPEQVQGVGVGPASDQFSIGVILYEMIAGESPFLRDSLTKTLQAVHNDYPVHLSRVRRGTPRDLAAIVDRAINKSPHHRYASMTDLTSDLHAYLDGRPVTSRPVTPLERMYRWCRRNPVLAVAVTASMIFLVLSGALILKNSREVNDINQQLTASLIAAQQHQAEAHAATETAERQRARAEAGELKALKVSYASNMKLLLNAVESSRWATAMKLVERQQALLDESSQHFDESIRGPEWWLARRFLHQRFWNDAQHRGAINELSVFPSRTKLATLGADGFVHVWEINGTAPPPPNSAIFKTPSQLTARILDTFEVPHRQLFAIDISPDESHVATVARSPFLRRSQVNLINLKTGKSTKLPISHNTNIEAIRYSPSGDYLISASRDDCCNIWSFQERKLATRWQQASPNQTIEFAAEGDGYFVCVGEDDRLCEVKLDSDEIVREYNAKYVHCFATNAATDRIIVHAKHLDHLLVFDRNSSEPIAKLDGPRSRCHCVTMNAKGDLVAMGTRFGWVHSWRLIEDEGQLQVQYHRPRQLHVGRINTLGFLDDNTLASCAADGRLALSRVLEPDTETAFNDVSPLAIEWLQGGEAAIWVGDDRWIYKGSMNGTDLPTERLLQLPAPVVSFDVAPNERFVAALLDDGIVRVYDLHGNRTPTAEVAIAGSNDIREEEQPLIITSDGQTLFTANRDRYLHCWDVPTGNLRRTLSTVWTPKHLTLTADESLLIAANATIRAFDTQSLRQVTLLDGGVDVTSLMAATCQGRNLTIAGYVDGSIKVWDLDDGQLQRLLPDSRSAITSLSISPDGMSFISGNSEGTLTFWHLPDYEKLGYFRHPCCRKSEIRKISFCENQELCLILRPHESNSLRSARLPLIEE